MYTLSNTAHHSFSNPQHQPRPQNQDIYVLDMHRTGDHLVAISSDQRLSVLGAARLADGPVSSWGTHHGNLTTLSVFDAGSGLVCTGGEDGTVGVWDLRAGAAAARVARFSAATAPVSSLACNPSGRTIAVGTELQDHSSSLHLWDVRALPAPRAHYQDLHGDDITQLAFHPSDAALLLSGSTDGLVNVYDTRVADEDDLTIRTFNHDASIHRAAFLTDNEVFALSHDEQFALYDVADGEADADALQRFGDLRSVLGCRYVAGVAVKTDGSGAVIGCGAQDRQAFELIFLAGSHGDPKWAFDRQNSVGLPGAHGDEIVRSFCFFDEAQLVFTAGEDGAVRAWRPAT